LIGLIVCETAKSDDDRLARLVGLLTKVISGDESAQALVRDRKQKKLSWNEIIQNMSRGEVE